MKIGNLLFLAAVLGGLFTAANSAPAQGTAFTYQGRLNSGGSAAAGSYDLTFALFATNAGGVAIAGPVTNSATAVSNGLFTTTVDFGAGSFTGGSNWLEIAVQTNGGGGFTTLTPRQQLTPTPYAITAASLSGVAQNDVVNGFNATVAGGGGNYSTSEGATVGGGEENLSSDAETTVAGGFFNRSTGVWATIGGGYGNVSTGQEAVVGGGSLNTSGGGGATVAGGDGNIANGGGAIVGGGYGNTSADYADSIIGGQGNLIQSNATFSTIGGGQNNTIQDYGSFIGGGGYNSIQSNCDASVVSGGYGNTIQSNSPYSVIDGGDGNTIQTNSGYSAIGGGSFNSVQASSSYSTIGGGNHNNIQLGGTFGFIGGGFANYIETNAYASSLAGGLENIIGVNASCSFIGGGSGNTIGANAYYATIPGGYLNGVLGQYSFAAGQNAQANHNGAFVWSDGSGGSFSSTANNQFSVQATGGVRFITSGTGMTLDGQTILANNQSSVTLNGTFNGNGGGLTLNAANITSGTLADARLSGNVALLNTSPTFAGDITMSGGAAYHHLALSGGNSTGYVYGSYPAFGDGVHLGYNYYADANGFPHVPDIGGGTSRITATFGEIVLAVGGVDSAPSSVRLDATTTGVTVMGSFVNDSDRNVKQDFAPVSSAQILDEVLRLPVSEWSYKVDPKTRHIGPVAQDFYSVFNIGADDKHIAPIDEGGLAFAAIQALNQKLEEKDSEIQNLKHQNDSLEKRLNELETTVKTLAERK